MASKAEVTEIFNQRKAEVARLFQSGASEKEISAQLNITRTRVNQILKAAGLKEGSDKYRAKIDHASNEIIISLHSQGQTSTEIARVLGITAAAIRAFLDKNSLVPNIELVDTSRPCEVCQTVFSPTHSDGPAKSKYKSCSTKCARILQSRSKIKYSQETIEQVEKLRLKGETSKSIQLITGVKKSKIKEIAKDSGLLYTPEQRQSNAYQGKVANNPNAMDEMRSVFHAKQRSPENLNYVIDYVLARGFEYVSGFTVKSNPFVVKCLTCTKNKEVSGLYTIIKGSCLNCSGCKRISAAEIQIGEWINSLGIETSKYKFKNRAGGIEIDVYVPSLKIGIEYCGLYWHNENSPTPRLRSYHKGKMEKANADGIRLITIFEDEWLDRNFQVKGYLASLLGKNTTSIFARKTEIKSVEKSEALAFLKANHIQGAAKVQVAFGLYHGEELVGLISGGKHHREGHQKTFVLNRLVFKSGTTVVGGSSKLLKALVDYAKSNGFEKLVSWSDNRWSEGNVYEKLGFTLEENMGPDYSYVATTRVRASKQSCTKANLLAKGAVGETESEMANSIGYNKIWDCGKKRWVISL